MRRRRRLSLCQVAAVVHNGLMLDKTAHLFSEDAFWTIAVGVLTNASCAILGCYLVLRRMSLLGDAISHSILPGIALAFLLAGRNPLAMFAGAMLMGLA